MPDDNKQAKYGAPADGRRLSLAQLPTIQKCNTNSDFFHSFLQYFYYHYFLFLLLPSALHLLLVEKKNRTFLSTWHSFPNTGTVGCTGETHVLASLDQTNGYEIQSNSRYFRSTVRYNRESDRSNLSAHWLSISNSLFLSVSNLFCFHSSLALALSSSVSDTRSLPPRTCSV